MEASGHVMLGWMVIGIAIRAARRTHVDSVERQAEAAQPELAAGS